MNQSEAILGPFTKADMVNIINLLRRAQFNGLEEAEVAVVLSQKIVGVVREADQAAKGPVAVLDGAQVKE